MERFGQKKKPMEWNRLFKYWCDKLDEGKNPNIIII